MASTSFSEHVRGVSPRGAIVLAVLVMVALLICSRTATPNEEGSGLGPAGADGGATTTGDDAGTRDRGSAGTWDSGALSGDAWPEGFQAYGTPDDLGGAVEELVDRYRKGGDCVVAQAGYLDLCGNVWGCVMDGGDWVDVCTVRELASGEGSVVRTMRLVASEGVGP